ncbi:hypothetical protein WI89_00885 [Burkholderia ubonensis]|uniref:XRE family transcriptional regulator n=1 Tax=Burkholderia ubonensis TaxID=101571 RepID=A0ABD4E9R3_9BURK|nr:hypothetical protein [Burkholderia ubonensis]KVD71809.1 hypothetical protein WI89_00885 [Burkholderia ubonensis]KVN92553.1 hypothetical protein WJ68_33565 [Burkholderia ubonensis]KVT92690.1 hypothetical protein WK60_13960 [Burkholderia ubonensis]KVZ57528.1 hypothetical protein WL19_03425 [Burkholderia ubonensis]
MADTIEQIRWRNFEFLFQQFKDDLRRGDPGAPDRGMLKKFAERLDLNPIYLSQINNHRKVIGTETSDKIEKRLNLEPGWMDTDHSLESLADNDDARAFNEAVMALYAQAPEASKSALLKIFSALVAGKPLDQIK